MECNEVITFAFAVGAGPSAFGCFFQFGIEADQMIGSGTGIAENDLATLLADFTVVLMVSFVTVAFFRREFRGSARLLLLLVLVSDLRLGLLPRNSWNCACDFKANVNPTSRISMNQTNSFNFSIFFKNTFGFFDDFGSFFSLFQHLFKLGIRVLLAGTDIIGTGPLAFTQLDLQRRNFALVNNFVTIIYLIVYVDCLT